MTILEEGSPLFHRYRPNVGLAVFNSAGDVFLGKRVGAFKDYAWQMLQGGIDRGEGAEAAAWRELREEVGLEPAHARLIGQIGAWLSYDFPRELMGRRTHGYIGQRQKWFAFRFIGQDSDIRLDLHTPEFSEWAWRPLSDAALLVVPFKRRVYDLVTMGFAEFARPERASAG